MARVRRTGSARRLVPLRARVAARRRRPPEQARLEILEAAERVFVEFQPDQVGLKDVAREAGVSHALVTHYFGTYAGLIEAVFERRIRALRELMIGRLQEAGVLARPAELLATLFDALQDPVHLRLTRWLLASERPAAAHAFALRDHGLQLIAHQVANALEPSPSKALIEEVELALMTAVAAAYGYAIGKYALVGALGRQASREMDLAVHRTLAEMLQGYIGSKLAK
ncbi:MAG: TetR/AcrR family transcriptional regulator [Deltaproteobacteria bacterium]|nr:TetR/AcrR family transcriptional regulator [Deltaproteobacteria bacterium]MDQ3301508.1 TetR/AcrR family transcriptional regulator [Myxococcota bacterium]